MRLTANVECPPGSGKWWGPDYMQPPEDIAKQITNPAAWAVVADEPEYDSAITRTEVVQGDESETSGTFRTSDDDTPRSRKRS